MEVSLITDTNLPILLFARDLEISSGLSFNDAVRKAQHGEKLSTSNPLIFEVA